jgi:hypothetical protein
LCCVDGASVSGVCAGYSQVVVAAIAPLDVAYPVQQAVG